MKNKCSSLIALALAAVLLLSGCSGQTQSSQSSQNSQSQAPSSATTANIGPTNRVSTDNSFYSNNNNQATLKIKKEDINLVESFDKEVLGIKVDASLKREERLEKVYSEIRKIAENEKYSIKEVNKNKYDVSAEFNNGILYCYPCEDDGIKEGTGKLHVRTIQPYLMSGDNPLNTQTTDEIASSMVTKVESTDFDLNLDDSQVTYDSILKIFTPNSVIIWDGHGGYDPKAGFYLPLGENSLDVFKNDEGLKDELIKQNFLVVCPGNRVCLTAALFDALVKDVSNSAIFLDVCHSMQDGIVAEVLLHRGASLVYGYSDEVSVKYGDGVLFSILEEMSKKTGNEYTHFEAASKIAREKYGDSDPYFSAKAKPTIRGDEEYHFDAAIANLPKDDNENDLADGKYYTHCVGAGEEVPEASKLPVCDSAEIKDGFLVITASFEKLGDQGMSTGELFPSKERRIKLSKDFLITQYAGNETKKYTADQIVNGGHKGKFGAPDFYLEIQNGEVLSCTLSS